jgi:DNA-binding response OmpR family regulator
MARMEPTDAAMAAIDPKRLIEGENPETMHVEDARHWLVVYSELLAFKESVLARTDSAVVGLHPESSREIRTTDVKVLQSERDRFRRHLEYWRRRLRELGGGVGFDEVTRLIDYRGGVIRLTRREAELFSYLLTRPGTSFRPDELAAEAWRNPALSAPQVRNYVVRLRRKLAEAQLPYDLISDPGVGYSLKRREPPEALSARHA